MAIEILEAPNGTNGHDAEQARLRATLLELVGTVSGLPEDLSENRGEKFADIVQAKHERSQR